MVEITLISVLGLVVVSYWFVDGSTFIKPWRILVLGVSLALLATLMKTTLVSLQLIPSFTHLDNAISVVEIILAALGGGLISSAFVIKMQVKHGADKGYLKGEEERLLEQINALEDELKWAQKELSSDSTNAKIEWIRRRMVEDRWALMRLRREINKVDVL